MPMADVIGAPALAPIQIRYDGLDAESHRLDMTMFGVSLQGAARIIAIAAHIAATGEYTNRGPSMRFRVLASTPEPQCVTIAAVLHLAAAASPIILEMPPADLIEKIANYILSSLGGKTRNESELELIGDSIQALRESNQANTQLGLEGIISTRTVALAAMEAIKEAANDQRPAARQFASPIGISAAEAIIGNRESAFVIDVAARKRIDFDAPEEILEQRPYTLRLSELDTMAGTCKAEVQGDPGNRRLSCTVADPVVHKPQSPYSNALNEKTWLKVSAKPHLQNGDLYRLTILDTLKA